MNIRSLVIFLVHHRSGGGGALTEQLRQPALDVLHGWPPIISALAFLRPISCWLSFCPHTAYTQRAEPLW